MRRRQDTEADRAHPKDMGWLGGHRKAREVAPPEPAAPQIGETATGKVDTAAAVRDFGNMANPLANGANRQKKVTWPFTTTGAIANAIDAQAATTHGHTAPQANVAPAPAVNGNGTHGGNGNGNGASVGAEWNDQQSAKAADAYFGNYGVRLRAANGTPTMFPVPEERQQLRPPAPEYRPPAPAPEHSAPPLGAWAGRTHADDEADRYDDEEEYATGYVPKVLVLDRGGQFSSDLARAGVDLEPAPEVFRLNRSTQVVEVAIQEEPDVIVVAPAEVSEACLRRLALVHREDPRIVIVLADNGKVYSPNLTAACGTSEIIPQNPTKAKLRTRLVRALETAEGLRREHLVVEERVVVQEAPVYAPEPAPAYSPAPAPQGDRVAFTPAPAPVRERQDPRSVNLARVFTVASASGGCGKTFYATNLAAYLVKATGGKVLLVDLDLQFGEVAISLHLRPKRTIAELVQEDDMAAALPDYLVEHSAGFKVLCAPKDPVTGDRVGPRETTAVLEAARTQFDYVVVDTPPSINETCLAAFDQSQSLIIMATMDLPSLKNLRIFLETLKKLNLPADQVALVVNKAESGTGIDLKEIEPLYPQGFSAVLPYAKQVSWSINMGVPVLIADPNAEITRKLVAGAVKLVPPAPRVELPWSTAAQTTVKRGWFMRLLKGNAK